MKKDLAFLCLVKYAIPQAADQVIMVNEYQDG